MKNVKKSIFKQSDLLIYLCRQPMMMSAWPDMKMSSKPLGGPGPISSSSCFSGRYSPTYRVPEHQMKRCNNTVRNT